MLLSIISTIRPTKFNIILLFEGKHSNIACLSYSSKMTLILASQLYIELSTSREAFHILPDLPYISRIVINTAFCIREQQKRRSACTSATLLFAAYRDSMIHHQDNMSVCFIPPQTPLLYSKTGVYKGIHYFLIFALNIYCGYSVEPPQ